MTDIPIDGTDAQALLKKALIELRHLRKQVHGFKRRQHEPIAVVGMACRFPGGCDTPDAYWSLLREGRSGIREVPKDRWDIDAYYDPDPDAKGKIYTRYGGYIDRIDGFDNAFFGISPKEAGSMDPQQRLVLEVAWEALEHAGINPQNLYGSNTGVFLGIGNWEHAVLRFGLEGPQNINAYTGTGSCGCVASGRISFALGLKGPNFAVDTACSSSLLSTHLACQSLRRGECDMALAGGAHLLLLPGMTVCFCRARMLAPDGRCKTFDANADGYVRSEGSGMLVLKRLSDALAAGDTIHALVRGSATNQDGASGGLTVPSGPAQEEVIRAALRDGGVDPAEVGYIEAHGTGTKLGDPVEIGALGNVFCKQPRRKPLVVGSVKTNMGHLESSAGISALIKTIMMLKHGEIPPHVNFQTPNPHIPWDRLALELPLQGKTWSVDDGEARLAGISSFGFSGTNVHVVLEDFQATQKVEAPPAEQNSDQIALLALSAKSPAALQAMAARYAAWLQDQDTNAWLDLCYSHNTGRAVFNVRAALCARDGAELQNALTALAKGLLQPGVWVSAGLGWDAAEAPAWLSEPVHTTAAQFVAGKTPAFSSLDYGPAPRKRTLPFYPFQHQVFPFQAEAGNAPGGAVAAPIHPLLGRPLHAAGHEILFESSVLDAGSGYLGDHVVAGRTLLAGAAFFDMALAAVAHVSGTSAPWLGEIGIREALVLDTPRLLQTVLRPKSDGFYRFQIFSRAAAAVDGAWTLHVEGEAGVASAAPDVTPPGPPPSLQRDAAWYAQFARAGFDYGPAFRCLDAVAVVDDQAWGEVALPQDSAPEGLLDPRLLDGAFQLVQIAAQQQRPQTRYVPVALQRLTLCRPVAGKLQIHTHIHAATDEHLKAAITLCDEHGHLVAHIDGIVGARLSEASATDLRALAYHRHAVHLPAPTATTESPTTWLLLAAADDPLAEALCRQAPGTDDRCLIAAPGHRYQRDESGNYRLDLTNRNQVERLFDEVLLATESARPACGGVVLMPSLSQGEQVTCAERAALMGVTVAQVLAARADSAPPRLWFATCDSAALLAHDESAPPFGAPLWGLRRVLAVEAPALQASCIDLAGDMNNQADDLRHALRRADSETETIWRNGERYVPRLARGLHQRADNLFRPPATAVALRLEAYGNTDRLKLVPQTPQAPQAGEVQIKVTASGLNFRDVLHALGMLEQQAAAIGIHGAEDMPFGFECCGVVSAVGPDVDSLAVGREVVAVLCAGSLADYVTVPAAFVIEKPAGLDANQAATLLTTFLTALHGLEDLAQVQAGDKVLIHAAAGGVGLSAVRLVQALGGDVYATASPAKWDFLRRQGVKHIMNSRTLDFADQIKDSTDGRGVDVVLNSLNGEFIDHSVAALAEGGRFIEIGKLGIWSAATMAQRRPDVRYHAFDLNEIAQREPAAIQSLLHKLCTRIDGGQVKPLPMQVFPITQAPQAFRTMAQGKHVGKVVLEVNPKAPVVVRPDAGYLITGGLGALGRRVAAKLIELGARNLLLLGRGVHNPDGDALFNRDDVTVVYRQVDVADADAVAQLIKDWDGPPLRGLIHAAGVLHDTALDALDAESMHRVAAAKITGTWALHQACADQELDFFVLFSSIAALLGNPGQANYAAANSFLDALAAYRRARQLPATTINWGAWATEGMTVDAAHLARLGAKALVPEQGLAALAAVLAENIGQTLIADIDLDTYATRLGLDRNRGLLADLLATPAEAAETGADLAAQIAGAVAGERPALMLDHVRATAAALMGYREDQIAVDLPLTDQGFDSLMAVELRNKLGRDVNRDLPVSLFYDYPTLEKLAGYLLNDVLAAAPAAEPATAPQAALDSNDVLAEIEMLLD